MKWFKHISDSLDDPFIFDLINEFGGDGYLVFFGILEILSREFDQNSDGFCTFSDRFLTKKLQLSRHKLVKILNFCEENQRFLLKYKEKQISIKCPKLIELCDEYTRKKIGILSGECQESVRKKSKQILDKEEDIDVDEEKHNKNFLSDSDEYRLSKLLWDLILERKPDHKIPNLKKWAEYVDLMIRVDKRSLENIENIIRWCQQDSFWCNNIRSTRKLREQYDQLDEKMKGDKNYGINTGTSKSKFKGISKPFQN